MRTLPYDSIMTKENFPTHSQSRIFLETEGDEWFLRNSEALESSQAFRSVDFILSTIAPFKNQINNIIEVGCGPAHKLERLFIGLEGKKGGGIDPSILSIEAARTRVVRLGIDLEMYVGISSDLPFQTNVADLVFLGFFLYLVPRDEMTKTVTEIDRILKPGCFLAIEDFDAPNETQNPYKHDNRVVTFKEDYAQRFIEGFGYHLIEKHSYCHKFDSFAIDPDERIATTVLFKPLIPRSIQSE
jgi:ubiquinone/menaquinone biosynthesis C-methylase UbiE